MPRAINPKVNATPLYALAGAGELAVAKLRELPASFQHLPANLQHLPANLQHLPANLQQQVGSFRSRAQQVAGATNSAYASLAERGRQALGAPRPTRRPSTRKASGS